MSVPETSLHEPEASRDPVCGMTVDPERAIGRGLTHTHADQTFYFCSAGCRGKFATDPDRYLDPAGNEQEPPPSGTIWT